MVLAILLRIIIYAAITVAFVYAFINDTYLFNSGKYSIMGFPFDDSYGRRAKFLTYINMFTHNIYFGLCTISAVTSLFCKDCCGLPRLLNFLYTRVVFPFGFVVVVTFWVVYGIDRELVFPLKLDSFLPSWQNHIMHTLPLVASIIDNYLTPHPYPTFINGMKYTLTFGLAYLAWVFFIAYDSGKWVYGMLAVLSNLERVGFVVGQLIQLVVAYKIGEFINNTLWSTQQPPTKKTN